MYGVPYRLDVKMTMHIDEAVLAAVVELTGAASKTEAVELALRDMARRHRLKQILRGGLGLTPEQLVAEFAPGPADAVDAPDVDEAKIDRWDQAVRRRRARRAAKLAAEDASGYGKPRSRR
jgi:hypothetical protein